MDKLKTGVVAYMDEQDKGNGKQEELSKTPNDGGPSGEGNPQTTTDADQTAKAS